MCLTNNCRTFRNPFIAQSPVPNQRTDSLKRRLATNSSPIACEKSNAIATAAATTTTDQIAPPSYQYNASIPSQTCSVSLPNSPKIVPSSIRHAPGHISSPKGSPLRRASASNHGSPKRQMGEEQWIDGPRLSKFKVAEARHLMREINHVKKCETWIDGPKSPKISSSSSPSKSIAVAAAAAATGCTQTYGYMDNHKKIMIRQWVENQTNQVFSNGSGIQANSASPNHSTATVPTATAAPNTIAAAHVQHSIKMVPITMPKTTNTSDDEEICIETTLNEITESLCGSNRESNRHGVAEISIRMTNGRSNGMECGASEMEHFDVRSMHSVNSSMHRNQNEMQEDEDQDSGPSEVPPALPLIEPLSSREISHDSIHLMCSRHVSRENLGLNIQTIDCGLQVTEEEIAREMGRYVLYVNVVLSYLWRFQYFSRF